MNTASAFFPLFLSFFIAIATVGCRTDTRPKNGAYWGAFDPPTEAHVAIIQAAIEEIPLDRLYVVINNHPYKNYAFSMEERKQMLLELIPREELHHVEILWQNGTHDLDYSTLRKRIGAPLCVIAGYDSYKKWVEHSTPEERAAYDAIAVVPRGDDLPILYDQNAFLLPIDPIYRDVSSTKARALLHK
jgi:cytidyltransferase-like protein